MQIDSRTIPAGEVIDTDVCIVGAGPAGIVLARELIGQKFRVCLLESGDVEFDAETQDLAGGETSGDGFPELSAIRRRQFGGLATTWHIQIHPDYQGLRHVMLDGVDFEKRDWLPHSGWPFDRSHLMPFYERAQIACQVGPFAYDSASWEDEQSRPLPFAGDRVTSSMFQFGPKGIFTNEYRKELAGAANVSIYLNANVVELETSADANTVTGVQVACLSGGRFAVRPKIVILATGAIENARLLLLSNRMQTVGLGNQHDLVGRYFMDHPFIHTGMFIPKDPDIFNRTALYDLRRVRDVPVMGKLTLTQDTMRRERLLNFSAMLYPRDRRFGSPAKAAAKALVRALRRGKIPQDAVPQFGRLIGGVDDLLVEFFRRKILRQQMFPDLSNGGWSLLSGNERRYAKFEVVSQSEQAPNPANRVTLSDKRDRLGSPATCLNVRWTDFERDSVRRSQAILGEQLGQFGSLQIDELEGNVSPSSHHNMGTTRMHDDPRQGVVDADCRVHGIANLFMAGGSVFPTGGFANPTLTIAALSIRLADRIKATLAAPKTATGSAAPRQRATRPPPKTGVR
jgi:choline dehydrogenase-like flavoprotein